MRIATIDIGTNTILMLIADISAGGSVNVVRDEQVIARLGGGVDDLRRITPDALTRALGFLEHYQRIADSCNVEKIVACGTSALRDAANSGDFIEFIRQKLGFDIEVLSGHKEAELTYQGAVSEFLVEEYQQSFAVLDIGGGSTELTTGVGTNLVSRESLDLGCVRLTERYLKTSPPREADLETAASEVTSWIGKLHRLPTETKLIGVAGTVTTLAAMELGLRSYDPKPVSGHFISIETVNRFADSLRTMTVPEMLSQYPQIQEGRADIIFAGMMILQACLKQLGSKGIGASDRGLRFGMALHEFLLSSHKS
jgi:exopolyphosphatase/guanosine-5'-triphosphate,3'-diphosphate pyrophosphatase